MGLCTLEYAEKKCGADVNYLWGLMMWDIRILFKRVEFLIIKKCKENKMAFCPTR